MSTFTPTRLPIAAALLLSCSAAFAVEYGTIVSSTPVIGQGTVPQRECHDEQVSAPSRSGGGGAVVGALIGGVVGNSIGAGAGRAAATALGAVAGAAIGDQADQNASRSVSTVQRCRTTHLREDRLIGYDVVYDYGGTRRSVRLPTDPGAPGSRSAVEVNVMPVAATRSGRHGSPVPPVPSRRSSADDGGYRSAEPVIEEERYDAPPPVYYSTQPPVYYAPPVVYGGPVLWIGSHWGHHQRHHGGHVAIDFQRRRH
jgi:uncharacterized protein YcfJ